MLLLTSIFGIVGFVSGNILLLLNLTNIKSFGKPYLIPFAPFYKSSQNDAIVRNYIGKIKMRPKYLTKKNIVKSGEEE